MISMIIAGMQKHIQAVANLIELEKQLANLAFALNMSQQFRASGESRVRITEKTGANTGPDQRLL